ncbi:hypothetical protein D9M73_126660 [compost metagenome]
MGRSAAVAASIDSEIVPSFIRSARDNVLMYATNAGFCADNCSRRWPAAVTSAHFGPSITVKSRLYRNIIAAVCCRPAPFCGGNDAPMRHRSFI